MCTPAIRKPRHKPCEATRGRGLAVLAKRTMSGQGRATLGEGTATRAATAYHR